MGGFGEKGLPLRVLQSYGSREGHQEWIRIDLSVRQEHPDCIPFTLMV